MKCKYDNTKLQAISESYYWCPCCGALIYEVPFGDDFGELDYQIPTGLTEPSSPEPRKKKIKVKLKIKGQ